MNLNKNNEVCLIILYNHNYEKNIPIVEDLYKNRFKNIFHIMPFYTGEKENVIPVYESSFQFSGYLTQALHKFYNEKYSHYIIVADDMLLNPSITENSFLDILNLNNNDAYIDELLLLNKNDLFGGWFWTYTSLMNMYEGANSCEGKNFLPPHDTAIRIFQKKGFNLKDIITKNDFLLAKTNAKRDLNVCYRYDVQKLETVKKKLFKKLHPYKYLLKKLFHKKNYNLDNFIQNEPLYPFARGYSDFLILPATKIKYFCHLCGIFAAMRVFVEIAIPTALVLTYDSIKTLKDIEMHSTKASTPEEREKMEKKYNLSLQSLNDNFPSNYLFIHPIKLSKWSIK